MIIQTFSPLQDSGSYFINNAEFEGRLMFTDTNSKLDYIVIRYDPIDSTNKVIASGLLWGNSASGTYQYKFDFDSFIKINQTNDLTATAYDATSYILAQHNTCKVYLLLKANTIVGINSILEANAANLTYNANGEVWCNIAPSSFIKDYLVSYHFYDKIDNKQIIDNNSNIILQDSFYPITLVNIEGETPIIWSTNFKMYVYNSAGSIIGDYAGYPNNNADGQTYFLYIDPSAVKVYIETENFTGWKQVEPNCNRNVWYFNGSNGQIDMTVTDANIHEVENTTRNYIQIANKRYPIRIETQKQLKVNTGFRLKGEQIYSLLKSPYIFRNTSSGTSFTSKRYSIDTTSFEGYNGSKLSERNIELILTDEKKYTRKTNFDLTFWD